MSLGKLCPLTQEWLFSLSLFHASGLALRDKSSEILYSILNGPRFDWDLTGEIFHRVGIQEILFVWGCGVFVVVKTLLRQLHPFCWSVGVQVPASA